MILDLKTGDNMEKAILVLSIDDGRADMYRLAKDVLIPRKIPATLNITTGKEFFKKFPKIKDEELVEIAKYPWFEIANHSRMHTNEADDIINGQKDLCDLLGYDYEKSMGFASPGSEMSMEYIRTNADELKKLGIEYVRTCEPDFFNREDDVFVLTSFPVMFEKPVEELKNMTDIAVDNKCNIIFLFHSVLKEGEENYNNTWSYDFDKFNLWLDYVLDLQSQGKLEIMTTIDYVKNMIK